MTFDLLRVSQAKHLGNRANLSLISKVFRLVFFSCILFVFFVCFCSVGPHFFLLAVDAPQKQQRKNNNNNNNDGDSFT